MVHNVGVCGGGGVSGAGGGGVSGAGGGDVGVPYLWRADRKAGSYPSYTAWQR